VNERPHPTAPITFSFPFRALPKANMHKVAMRGRGRFARRTIVNDLTGVLAKSEESFAIQALARTDLRDRDLLPWTCPIDAEATFVYAVPDSWPPWKKEAALAGRWLHVESPDLDNTEKFLWDALEGTFYVNDKQIQNKQVAKAYGCEDRISVALTPRQQAVAPAKPAKKVLP